MCLNENMLHESVCTFLFGILFSIYWWCQHSRFLKKTLKQWSLLGLNSCSIFNTGPQCSMLIEVWEDWVCSAVVCVIPWRLPSHYWVFFLCLLVMVIFLMVDTETSLYHYLFASYNFAIVWFMYLKTFIICIHVDHIAFWKYAIWSFVIDILYFFTYRLGFLFLLPTIIMANPIHKKPFKKFLILFNFSFIFLFLFVCLILIHR